MTERLTNKQRKLLRVYWQATYSRVIIKSNGEVWAQRRQGESMGLLETASMAIASAKVLEARERSRLLAFKSTK